MKNYIKDALIGISAILLYFILTIIQTLPFDIININLNELPLYAKVIYLLIYELMVICIMLLLFNKKIKRDFKDILINHKDYYSKCIKYWLIGLVVMSISNSLALVVGGDIASNEESLRQLFKISPLYIYLSSTIYAPIVEELVFRQGIRNIFGRNYLFILVSGIVFGGLHVITGLNSIVDLIYLIPYSSLGIAFAYMLYKTDNIFVSMGFHFMHNGLLIAFQFLLLLFS
jgi:membrane protease YdiL (CAAX protease family)